MKKVLIFSLIALVAMLSFQVSAFSFCETEQAAVDAAQA